MTAALGSGSAPLPSLPQPRPRVAHLILGSGPSPFEATRQPSKGRPEAEVLRFCAPARVHLRLGSIHLTSMCRLAS